MLARVRRATMCGVYSFAVSVLGVLFRARVARQPITTNAIMTATKIPSFQLVHRAFSPSPAWGGIKSCAVTAGNSNASCLVERSPLRLLVNARRGGGPCVVVNCHPAKYAKDDNIQPVGGGAFVAEMDGNLTCIGDGDLVEVHWQTKLRGPDFLPIKFELKRVTTPALRDSKGRNITTVMAGALSDSKYAQRVAQMLSEEDKVLDVMRAQPGISIAKIAGKMQWLTSTGQPHKARVHRVLQKLLSAGRVKKYRGRYSVVAEKTKKHR